MIDQHGNHQWHYGPDAPRWGERKSSWVECRIHLDPLRRDDTVLARSYCYSKSMISAENSLYVLWKYFTMTHILGIKLMCSPHKEGSAWRDVWHTTHDVSLFAHIDPHGPEFHTGFICNSQMKLIDINILRIPFDAMTSDAMVYKRKEYLPRSFV